MGIVTTTLADLPEYKNRQSSQYPLNDEDLMLVSHKLSNSTDVDEAYCSNKLHYYRLVKSIDSSLEYTETIAAISTELDKKIEVLDLCADHWVFAKDSHTNLSSYKEPPEYVKNNPQLIWGIYQDQEHAAVISVLANDLSTELTDVYDQMVIPKLSIENLYVNDERVKNGYADNQVIETLSNSVALINKLSVDVEQVDTISVHDSLSCTNSFIVNCNVSDLTALNAQINVGTISSLSSTNLTADNINATLSFSSNKSAVFDGNGLTSTYSRLNKAQILSSEITSDNIIVKNGIQVHNDDGLAIFDFEDIQYVNDNFEYSPIWFSTKNDQKGIPAINAQLVYNTQDQILKTTNIDVTNSLSSTTIYSTDIYCSNNLEVYKAPEPQSIAVLNSNDLYHSIYSKLQPGGTTENQYVTKDFVNSSINAIAAYFIVRKHETDLTPQVFTTFSDLSSTKYDELYTGNERRHPTRNDYCVVLSDETHIDPITKITPTARYVFSHSEDYVSSDYDYRWWQYQYTVNSSPFTDAQWKTINAEIEKTTVVRHPDNQSVGTTTLPVYVDENGTVQPCSDLSTAINSMKLRIEKLERLVTILTEDSPTE